MSILEFVSSSEYRKERARLIARSLVSQIGVRGLMDATDETAADMIAVLGKDISGLARQAMRDALSHAETLGLGPIDDIAAQATLEEAIRRVLTAAQSQLTARLADLTSTLDRMLGSTAEATVLASLASQVTQDALLSPITAVMSAAAAGAVSAVETDIAAETVAAFHEQTVNKDEGVPLFEWQTREDGNVCEDIFENSCAPRHGQQLTIEEWQTFGDPGSPDSPTICAIFAKNPGASNCRCVLIPAGSEASTPQPINIADAARAGKERAMREAA